MKVQQVQFGDGKATSWLVLDDAYTPILPICSYLKFRSSYRAPATVRREAYHLKLFWDYLEDKGLDWKDVHIERLAGFIDWLRDPALSTEYREARRMDATIDLALAAVHEFYNFHSHLAGGPELALYQFIMHPRPHYKPFLYGISKAKPTRERLVKVKGERHLPKTLSREQIMSVQRACRHVRDALLVALLHDTGIRIGECLGLRHEDVKVEGGEIRIVPRKDNANGARVKSGRVRSVFPSRHVLDLYVRYVIEELNGLESDALPDFVFVNLWGGEVGRPMDYDAVRSLYRRLQKRTLRKAGSAVPFTPHKLRHSFATETIKAGVSLPTVSRLLGHSSIQTTIDIYHHMADEDIRAELEAARKSDRAPHEL
jgi:integrase/recombinase XerD